MFPLRLKISEAEVEQAKAQGKHDELVMRKFLERLNEIKAETLSSEDAARVSITQTGTNLQTMNFRFEGPTELVRKVQSAINEDAKTTGG